MGNKLFSGIKNALFEEEGVETSGSTNGKVSIEELSQSIQDMKVSMGTAQPAAAVEMPANINVEGIVSIDEIYAQFNLSDKDRSIFKVDEFAKVLPTNLPTDIRRQSVLGILQTSKLDITELISDSTNRQNALVSVRDGFTNETINIVETSEAEIQELSKQIDELKAKINDRKILQEQQEQLIQTEVNNIDTIVKFINPEVK